MTFLEMCQRLIEKCGISGTITTVTGRSGEHLRVVNWIKESWTDIQRSNSNWDWMRDDFAFDTTANIGEYTPTDAGAPDMSKWHLDTFRIYKKSIGVSDEQFLPEMDYKAFRDTYRYGVQTPGKPSVFSVKPSGNKILLGVLPDDIYTVTGEYQRTAMELVANADIPEMPTDFHIAIVHKARIKYAMFENAAEVLAEAQSDYNNVMSEITALHLPSIDAGAPLA